MQAYWKIYFNNDIVKLITLENDTVSIFVNIVNADNYIRRFIVDICPMVRSVDGKCVNVVKVPAVPLVHKETQLTHYLLILLQVFNLMTRYFKMKTCWCLDSPVFNVCIPFEYIHCFVLAYMTG